MKKLLKFLLFFILFILVVLFTAPILFKGKIIKIAHEQINNNINAKASFDDINLSFFKHFPYLTAGIKQLTVEGIDEFEGDTLLYVKSFELAANVISAIKMENIEIKKIAIIEPSINAKVLESGKANWDIAKETEEKPVEEDVDTTASEFDATIALKKFIIADADINYTDESSGMEASLKDFDFDLSGDFSQKFSTLIINSSTEELNFVLGGIRYLRDVALNIFINVDANLEDNVFVLQENSFGLNDFILTIDGKLEMPEEQDMSIDMTYATNNADFKTLLSLVPAIYMRDFADLKTTGSLVLNGSIKGNVGENVTPDVDGKLLVQNATFSYPDLPKSASNINIDIAYFYDGKQMDNTTVDVNKFHVELGGNPIDMSMNLRTPISDPFINSAIDAKIDLKTLSDLIPMEDTELKGLIDINLDLMGNMSVIEEEKYEDFKAVGKVLITDFLFASPDAPQPVIITKADLGFSPQYLAVNAFKAELGKSDFGLDGKVTNYLPFVLHDGTLKGEFNFKSNTIDLNEFMSEGSEEEEEEIEETDTIGLSVVEVPANIDFTLNSSINKIYYDKLEIDDVKGKIFIRDSRVVMEKLKMNMLEGNIELNGEYNTQDIANPLIDFGFQANSIDIPQAFTSFDVLEKIAPIASKATGKVSIGMDLSSFLNQSMKPIMNSMVGTGNLSSQRIGVKSSDAFTAIGNQLNTDAFKEMVLNDLLFDFEIRGGKLFVNPFETKMGNTNLMIAGEQGFDKTMDYGINLSVPRSVLGTANTTISNLAADKGISLASAENLNMLVKVTGDMAKPKVSIDMKESLAGTTDAVKEEIKATAKKEIETRKEDAKKQAKAEADKIMKEAEAKAEQVRKEAKKLADGVRYEANNNADKLMKEAGSNPIAKRAAEIPAKKLREEGEKKAQKIESEADAKAQNILDEAQKKADQLLK
jgi:hypothetical protein